ncbi:MAG: hypothetical protein LBI96_06510 [Odoribacteraceae bacterium]|jgi:hypothetical protein|nr:hypothetical protein [Odoribacteraceae bacterium]
MEKLRLETKKFFLEIIFFRLEKKKFCLVTEKNYHVIFSLTRTGFFLPGAVFFLPGAGSFTTRATRDRNRTRLAGKRAETKENGTETKENGAFFNTNGENLARTAAAKGLTPSRGAKKAARGVANACFIRDFTISSRIH